MDWQTFYRRMDKWYDGVIPSVGLSELSDLGSKAELFDALENLSYEDGLTLANMILDRHVPLESNEFMEIFDLFVDDEETAKTLLEKAMADQILFTGEDLEEISGSVSEDYYIKLLRYSIEQGTAFSGAQILEIISYLDDEQMNKEIVEYAMAKNVAFSTDDIYEICCALDDIPFNDRLILHSLQRGMVFSPDEICDLEGEVSKRVLTEAVKHISRRLTEDELYDLEDVVSKRLLMQIDKQQHTHAFDDWDVVDEDDEDEPVDDWEAAVSGASTSGKKKKKGFFSSFLAANAIVDDLEKRKNRRSKDK